MRNVEHVASAKRTVRTVKQNKQTSIHSVSGSPSCHQLAGCKRLPLGAANKSSPWMKLVSDKSKVSSRNHYRSDPVRVQSTRLTRFAASSCQIDTASPSLRQVLHRAQALCFCKRKRLLLVFAAPSGLCAASSGQCATRRHVATRILLTGLGVPRAHPWNCSMEVKFANKFEIEPDKARYIVWCRLSSATGSASDS